MEEYLWRKVVEPVRDPPPVWAREIFMPYKPQKLRATAVDLLSHLCFTTIATHLHSHRSAHFLPMDGRSSPVCVHIISFLLTWRGKIEKHNLSHGKRVNRCMAIDDLKEQAVGSQTCHVLRVPSKNLNSRGWSCTEADDAAVQQCAQPRSESALG
jgi:hypothetical protein